MRSSSLSRPTYSHCVDGFLEELRWKAQIPFGLSEYKYLANLVTMQIHEICLNGPLQQLKSLLEGLTSATEDSFERAHLIRYRQRVSRIVVIAEDKIRFT